MSIEQKITDSREIDLDKIARNGFVDLNKINDTINELKKVKIIVDELLDIVDNTDLPQPLAQIIKGYNFDIINFVNQIEVKENESSEVIARKKDQVIKDINSYCNIAKSLKVRHNSNSNLLEVYAIAKSFVKEDQQKDKEIENLEKKLDESLERTFDIIDTLNNNKNQSENILNELKKKISEYSVSNYAEVFQKKARQHRNVSIIWLISGITIAVIFIITIIVISTKNFLPTELYTETGEFLRYNFTNLVTKILIIAVLIFLMSFSFKQYNINKHLETLNTHRQNALNSYELFTKSIVGDDTNSRNALMIQVAKAIYEHSQSTGFLNEKNQNVNSGILELTKIIGQQST